VVRGSVGLGAGTPQDAFLRAVRGQYTACSGWFINGASGGPQTIWEVHLLAPDTAGLRKRALAVQGVEAVTVAPRAGLTTPPVTGGRVTASACA
jgi:hypothetical protein